MTIGVQYSLKSDENLTTRLIIKRITFLLQPIDDTALSIVDQKVSLIDKKVRHFVREAERGREWSEGQ